MPPLSSDHRTQAGQGPFSAGLALDETGQSQYQGRYWGAGTSREKELGIPVTTPPPPPEAGTEDLHYPETQGRAWRGLELCRGKESPWWWEGGGCTIDPGGPEWASLGILSHQVEVKGRGGEMQDAKALFCKANVTDRLLSLKP